ncbi:HAD hydrolase family protein [Clostridium sp. CCUG 7971]|uniref:HAD hydrolase family protein n=1 Tax=Clostridium sp. CCUG 7971 TaxID=2811414 RepID=UPI001ABA3D6A|nr:HAD hydrolase family protein [Clostridium sp. CCUG 7971]MBO3443383.1 HAD hydrolase family protein [Clostridium sp. CCUG 7971]
MIVFSDLDRSVIYSNKFLNTDRKYENIEIYNNKDISYISLDTIKYIKKIQEDGLFIPTTTRTFEQFKRINFSSKNIEFTWAITSNGGTILRDNKIFDKWNKEVDKILQKACPIEKMVSDFEKYTRLPGITNFKIAEKLFFYIVVDYNEFKVSMIEEYTSTLGSKNWTFYVSGRKIYFLPKDISKENAIDYLVNYLEIEKFSVIGDSTMDLGMLNIGHMSYVLRHGDLLKYNIDKNFIISKYEGMRGSEEVLSSIIENFNLEIANG